MKNLVYGFVLAAVLALGLAGLVTCENPAGDGVARVQDRHLYKTTWVAAADGANGAVTSTKIDFTFSRAVAGLTAEDIEVVSGAQLAEGETIKGALTGSGTAWSLALTDQSIAENVRVRVFNDDVESKTRDVAVYREGAATTLLWTARADGADGAATSTKIDFAFSGAVAGLTAADITVTDGTGVVTKGALTGNGAAWALGLTVATAGNVAVDVSNSAVASGEKYIDVYKQGGGLGTGHHEEWVNAESITVSDTVLSLDIDATYQLTATVGPPDTNDTVVWTSEKPTAVSVDDTGLVTAVSPGTVWIKAAAGGAYAVCVVTVKTNSAGLFENDTTLVNLEGVSGDNLLAKSFAYISGTNADDVRYTIVLDNNITTDTGWNIGTGAGASSSTGNNKNKNLKITLRGLADGSSENGYDYAQNVVVTKSGQGALFTVYGTDATDVPELTLENITLKGNSGNNTALVVVGNAAAKKGALTMKAGSRITGNTNSLNGGGVNIVAGTLVMNEGLIDENQASGNGGGVCVQTANGIFFMKGGTIEKNTVTGDTDNYTAGQGGGIFTAGTVELSGGFVQDNTAALVCDFDTGVINIGGGVHFNGGSLTITENIVIRRNTAVLGGGLYLLLTSNGTTVTMTGGSIEGNTALKLGAGINIEGNKGTFTKTSGTIYGTTSTESGKANTKTVDASSTVHAIEHGGLNQNWDGFETLHFRDVETGTSVSLNTSDWNTGWSTP